MLARGPSGVPSDGGHDVCQPLVARCLCADIASSKRRETVSSSLRHIDIYVRELSACRCAAVRIDRVPRIAN